MGFAIIRNTKYKMNNLNGIYRHIERKNTNYSNKEIDKSRGINNFSIKACPTTYEKRFNQIRNDYKLKGQIKITSNVMCEYIITSSKSFFETLSDKELNRYFQTAFSFVSSYKNLGEQYILSAKVHMDESTPHMHIVFMPVVHTKDKNNNDIDKLSCSEFWKGKNSYKQLQDNFFKYMTRSGFDLERGYSNENSHISIEDLKVITDYQLKDFKENSTHFEKEIESDNIEEIKTHNKKLIKKFNTLSEQYTKIYNLTKTKDNSINILQNDLSNLQKNYIEIDDELSKYKRENKNLKKYINKIFEYFSTKLNKPFQFLQNIVNDYINKENPKNDSKTK